MKQTVVLAALLAVASARPTMKREVPQEHSHQPFLASVSTSLNKNNPDAIADPVFGLLGNAAAKNGLGKITDPDCLQQATADQAFTNAKAAGDVQGMTDALIYRALERNTGSVGLASVKCTAIKAKNPEIAAIQQHQDPASDNAAATNKAIVLELAKQIASIGGDPQQALQSGTFAPGQKGDPTAKGNTCDDANDAKGCIVSQNLLVEDATAAEIDAAVKGVAASGTAASGAANSNNAGAADSSSAACAAPAAAAAGSANSGSANANAGAAASSANSGASNSSASAGDAAAAASGSATGAASAAGAQFGKCANAGIVFGAGFDGRKENSFQPADKQTFNHGSALNIGVITDFIISRLQDTNGCGSNAAAVDAAKAAQTAAKAATGQASADAWNKALGL